MTKADSKKLILFNVLEEYFYIAVIYLLALNFFVKPILIVPWLFRGFVIGTRFSIYGLHTHTHTYIYIYIYIFFFCSWPFNNFWSIHSLRRSATTKESSDDQSGTNGMSTKFTNLFVIKVCMFCYCGMCQQHRSYCIWGSDNWPS